MASQKMATVEITCNTKRATERLNEYVGLARKKINELAILNDSLNEKRRLGLEITKQEIARQKQLETEIKELNTAQTRGIDDMKKAREVMNDLANSSIKEVNKAIRDMTKEMNGLRDVNSIRKVQQDIDKLRVSLDEKMKVSITELTGSLKNLNNISTEKLRQNLQAIRKEMEREPEDTQWARYLKNAERATQAQIAINEYGQMGKAPATGSLASEDRLRAEAERQRLVTAYQAASRSDDAAHKSWAAQALKEIQQYNSALQALTETERKDAQMKAEQKKAADALAAATKTSDAIARNQKVTIQELAEAQKYYETELKKLEGLNLSPQDQQQVDAMKAKLDAVNATLQDISRADIDKVLSDIDSQSLETLEATLKKLKEEAATFKIGDDREIKDAVSDMTELEQAISRFKDKLAGFDQLDFDHLENVPTEKLEAALKRIEEEEKKLAGIDEQLAQQMAENKTKVVNQLNRNKQATIDYANAEKVVAERGKHSVTEMQVAYDALQQKLLSLRADEHSAIRQTQMQMRTLKNDINEVKGEVTGLTKLWKTAVRNIATYVGVFAGFNLVKSKIMEIAKDSLALSDSMAQVQKVTGLASKEIDTLNYSLAKLDTRTTLTQLNDLAFSAGKMGLGKYGLEGVEGFVRATNQLQVALGDDLGNSVDEAITPLAKLAENLGLIQKMGVEKSMMAIGSSINELSQTTTAVGANIVDFARRIQPAAQMINLTGDQILALGSAADSFGVSSEIAATAFTKFLAAYRTNTAEIERILGIAKGTLDQYFDQGRTIEGLMAIFQRMHDIGDLRYLEEAFKALGSEGSRMFTTFGAFSKNIDMFREHLATSTKAFQEATSVTREFNLVQETAQGLMERSSNIWRNAFVNPEGVDAMKQFAQAWYDVSRAMTGNKAVMAEIKFLLAGIVELAKILVYLLPALAGGLAVLGAGRGIVALREALEFSKISKAVTGLTFSLNGLKAAWTALSAVGKANWIGLIATAVFAAIEAFGMFNKKVQEAGVYLKDFRRDLGDLNVEYGKGEAELRRYRRAIDEANAGSKQRAAAIAQFNSKFKPYLSNLLTEKSTALDVAKAYKEVCKQMQAKIAMQLKEKDINEQVTPREQWTVQRREEYDRQAREAGMGQYGADWITGFAQDNQNKSIDTLVRTIGKQYYNLPQQIVDEVAKQAAAGNRQFNNYGNIINSKYLGQANALLAAGSYIRQDRSTMNTMQQVNKKWAPEEKRISDYLASQEQETSSFNPDDLPPSKEELKAAKKAEAERRKALRAEMKEEQAQAKAIIDNVKNYYQRQINAITELANTTGMDPKLQEQMVNGMKERMNEALANVRKAIGGTKNDWEAFKQTMRDDLYEPLGEDGTNLSTELLDKVMDNNLDQLRTMIEKLSKELNQQGSVLLDQILRKASENEGINAKIENALMRAREKELLERNYTGKVDKDTEGTMEQFGIAAITDAQSKQIRDWSAQGNDAAIERFLEMRTKYWQVAFGNARKNLLDLLQQDVNTKQGQESVLQLLFGEDWKEGLTGSELEGILNMTADQWQVFYMKLIEYTDRWTDAQKKAYDENKKRQDYIFNNRTDVMGLNTLEIGYEQQAKANQRWGKPQTFAERMGLGSMNELTNDPEVKMMEIKLTKAELYYKRMEELRKTDQISEEQLMDAKKQWSTAQEALMDKLAEQAKQKMEQIQQLLDPIKEFGAAAGDAMYLTVNGLEGEGEAWRNAVKNIIKTYGEMTIQMIEKQLLQMIVMKQHHQEQEDEEQAHQDRMKQIQNQGDTNEINAQNVLNAKIISTKRKANKTEEKEDKKAEDEKVNIAGEGGTQLLDIATQVGTGMVTAKKQEADQTQQIEQQQQATSLSGLISDTVAKVVLGIAGGSAKTISELGWWGLPLVAVISAALMGLLNFALSAIGGGGGGNNKAATKPKVKLASGMLTYDEGNVQQTVGSQWRGKNGEYITDERRTVVGDDGRVYRAKEQRSLPEGVSMVTEPIATRVNGQQALVGERGPEIVIGRRTTRAIQMNRPDLLRDLALIDRGITTRKVRTFDEGNISDMATAFAGQLPAPQQSADGQQGGGEAQRERDRAMLATLGVLSQTIGQLQQQLAAGIHAEMNMFGDNGAYKKFQQADKFYKRYGG